MLGTVTIHKGKGRKGRTVPIGAGTPGGSRYLDEARPDLVAPPGNGGALLSERGERPSTSTT
ncbi:MAG: hypothetical protein IPG04_09445 [Polyangiaceae bacterium]|nr:hypothetical protein [Polyangiaceae bacterium]